MMDKRRAVFYLIGGGYLLYLAYQLSGTVRNRGGGKDDMVLMIFSVIFAIAGAALLTYTAVMYIKMLKAGKKHRDGENGENENEAR